MPVYSYKCTCGERFERFLRVAEYKEPQYCPACAEVAEKVLAAPAVLGDYAPYTCPITGKIIEGRAAHKQNLARHGCRVLEPGESRDVSKRQAAADEKFFEQVGETAAREVASWSSTKQEKLANELDAGLDVKFERQTVKGVNHA